jgi:hypothetical protein
MPYVVLLRKKRQTYSRWSPLGKPGRSAKKISCSAATKAAKILFTLAE